MGAHKSNPTAIAAKEGKLPPKPVKKSKREREREIQAVLTRITGIDNIYHTLGLNENREYF